MRRKNSEIDAMAEVPENVPTAILVAYFQRIPGYGFDPQIDHDFAALDVLEEVKAFRWYHNNRPAEKVKSVRLGLRRWLARTLERRSQF